MTMKSTTLAIILILIGYIGVTVFNMSAIYYNDPCFTKGIFISLVIQHIGLIIVLIKLLKPETKNG